MTYEEWISQNVKDNGYGQCHEATEAMAQAFPELSTVRGHYECPIWGTREHWWLVAPDGRIVDPTVEQFPSKGIGEYTPLDEEAEEPVGKCANCGEYSYASKGGDTPYVRRPVGRPTWPISNRAGNGESRMLKMKSITMKELKCCAEVLTVARIECSLGGCMDGALAGEGCSEKAALKDLRKKCQEEGWMEYDTGRGGETGWACGDCLVDCERQVEVGGQTTVHPVRRACRRPGG